MVEIRAADEQVRRGVGHPPGHQPPQGSVIYFGNRMAITVHDCLWRGFLPGRMVQYTTSRMVTAFAKVDAC